MTPKQQATRLLDNAINKSGCQLDGDFSHAMIVKFPVGVKQRPSPGCGKDREP